MRAILIDVYAQEIRECDISQTNTLDDWYKTMGVDLVAVGLRLDDTDSILVDDEGLLKPCDHFFYYEGSHQPFAGNGLITGVDDEGESISCVISLDDVKNNVRFMSRDEVITWVSEQSNS